MATRASPTLRWRNDRVFYTGMGLFIALIGFAGFAQSFYLSRWMEVPSSTPDMTGLLYFHGAVFTAWLILTVVQPMLIASGKRQLHRTLGYGSLVVAILMVVVGNLTAIAAMDGGFKGLGDPRIFYAVPFFAINSFAVTAAFAFIWRNRSEAHKRLILLSNVGLIGAAVARIPLEPLAAGAPFTFVLGPNIITLAGIFYDLVSRGRVHRVWIWGGLLMLASQLVMFPIMGSAAWMSFAQTMAALW